MKMVSNEHMGAKYSRDSRKGWLFGIGMKMDRCRNSTFLLMLLLMVSSSPSILESWNTRKWFSLSIPWTLQDQLQLQRKSYSTHFTEIVGEVSWLVKCHVESEWESQKQNSGLWTPTAVSARQCCVLQCQGLCSLSPRKALQNQISRKLFFPKNNF